MNQVTPKHLEPHVGALHEALELAWQSGYKAIEAAFEAGRAAGKNEASEELRDRLASVLNVPMNKAAVLPPLPPLPSLDAEEQAESKRATRGSIRPTVIRALSDYGLPGLRPSEIASRTGLNENSVRGTLNTLAHEGVTTKIGDLWVLSVAVTKTGA
jgi:IclR helix-turn-helix domain